MKEKVQRLGAAFCVAAVIVIAVACIPQYSLQYESDSLLRSILNKPAPYPVARFVVVSDLHTFDPSLGTKGKAFENYLSADYKLTGESAEILQTATGMIQSENASFVLIPGDLTKDGERASHELVAQYLKKLEETGKRIYVIPGNHDIKSGSAYKFVGNMAQRVPNISADEFAQIYGDFGFKDALFRDPASLSYLAWPEKGLWLLALDSCRYEGKEGEAASVTGGRFSAQTLMWIERILIKAARENVAVIAMMHHGAVEHFKGQAGYFPEYVIDNYQAVSKLFAEYNVRLVFTGHFHAQDITERSWPQENKFLFDVETGSLVTYPCPYRVVNIDSSQKAAVRTVRIQSIPSHQTGFQDYARTVFEHGVTVTVASMIMKYGIGPAEAVKLAGQVAEASVVHIAGDEKLADNQTALQESGLSLPAWLGVQFYKGLIYNELKDLPPPDNNVTLDLQSGGWQ